LNSDMIQTLFERPVGSFITHYTVARGKANYFSSSWFLNVRGLYWL
jgi:hypothetical protein